MEITEKEIFKIDLLQSEAETIDHSLYGDEFETYLHGLIELVMTGSTGRSFKFDRDTTEVRAQISKIIEGGNFSEISKTIADRLLNCEKVAQSQMDKLGIEIQKGIFIQAIVQDEERKFIICKADNSEYLNEINFKLSRGLPIKKKVFKGFVCTLNDDNSVADISVFDLNLTKYWWREFLELTTIRSDEVNTQNAFDAIEKSVLKKLKSKHPQDYMHLSNSNIHYFRSNSNFNMDEYIQNVYDTYLPFDDSLDLVSIKKTIRDLPKQTNRIFDPTFEIVKSKIKKRFIKDVTLTPLINLHFKQEIPDLENVVTAVKDADGTKYVKIKSDEGYKFFNDKKSRN